MSEAIENNVREFYAQLPFNYFGSVESAVKSITSSNPISLYPNLAEALDRNDIKSALEVGCGAGWFAISLANYYKVEVTAFDFTSKALERAELVSQRMGLQISFKNADIFEYEDDRQYDLVNSIGVLHHTKNAKEAFMRIARFVKPGKYIHIGLYHYYGRKVFMEHILGWIEKHGERSAMERFRTLSGLKDDTHLESWFRDQALHPHETTHTLKEVADWLDEAGFALQSTSVNRFQPFNNQQELFELEKGLEDISYQRNILENKYFPGFFTVLAKRI